MSNLSADASSNCGGMEIFEGNEPRASLPTLRFEEQKLYFGNYIMLVIRMVGNFSWVLPSVVSLSVPLLPKMALRYEAIKKRGTLACKVAMKLFSRKRRLPRSTDPS